MIGTNTLILNEATMIEALQEYFDKRMPEHKVDVKSVTQAGFGISFEVRVSKTIPPKTLPVQAGSS